MADLIASNKLEALGALDRALLHVFVAGPGEGEAIAVALPERGWILLDGCRAVAGIPLLAILRRWRAADDPIVAFVLTHPHDDHAKGVAEVLEEFPPEHVAVTGELLRREAHGEPVTSRSLLARTVNAALDAIESWAASHPGRLLDLVDGGRVPQEWTGGVEVDVRAPDGALAKEVLADLARTGGAEANCVSGVLEIMFGRTRVVLGADLPRFFTGTKRKVPTGWDLVLARHNQLGLHAMLKIPHHGSPEAYHSDLMTKSVSPRSWCITPYNRSDLPSVVAMDGLPQLLKREPLAQLTAPPISKSLQAAIPPPGIVRIAQLVDRMKVRPTGVRFVDTGGVEVTPRTAIGELDAVWCVAFDADGALRARWRGTAALDVAP